MTALNCFVSFLLTCFMKFKDSNLLQKATYREIVIGDLQALCYFLGISFYYYLGKLIIS